MPDAGYGVELVMGPEAGEIVVGEEADERVVMMLVNGFEGMFRLGSP